MVLSTIVVFTNLDAIEKQNEALDNRVVQIRLMDDIRANLAFQGLYARALVLENTDSNRENLLTYAENLSKYRTNFFNCKIRYNTNILQK